MDLQLFQHKPLALSISSFFAKVMEAEQTKTRSELVHKETAAKYNAAMGRMKQLEKKLKRAINKSKYVFLFGWHPGLDLQMRVCHSDVQFINIILGMYVYLVSVLGMT